LLRLDSIRVISCIVDDVTDSSVPGTEVPGTEVPGTEVPGTEVPGTEHLGPDYFQDPLSYFTRLRERCPVAPVTLPGDASILWTITRYADVRAALADPRLHKDWMRKMTEPGWTPDPATGFLNTHMLAADPPDHTRLRRLVQKAFTPGRVAALRPRIEAITASLLDAMELDAMESDAPAGENEVDLIAAFAFPLPMTVISELIGVPDGDRDEFSAWSHVILSATATADEFRAAGAAMYGYFMSLIAAKRAAPADDLLSALIAARDSGDALDESELLAMMFLLLVAGHETTVNLIASGMLALLEHPAELARLRADPALLPGAVEELLRYANPLNHATERFTLEPVEIGGVTIPARAWVLCVTSSANRDPDRFDSPDVLDVGRDAGGHVAFGHGIHHCLGAPLARLEGEIAFGALLARFPSLTLAADPAELRWRPSSLMHGLEKLPVLLG
jgi:cytochrome P450